MFLADEFTQNLTFSREQPREDLALLSCPHASVSCVPFLLLAVPIPPCPPGPRGLFPAASCLTSVLSMARTAPGCLCPLRAPWRTVAGALTFIPWCLAPRHVAGSPAQCPHLQNGQIALLSTHQQCPHTQPGTGGDSRNGWAGPNCWERQRSERSLVWGRRGRSPWALTVPQRGAAVLDCVAGKR